MFIEKIEDTIKLPLCIKLKFFSEEFGYCCNKEKKSLVYFYKFYSRNNFTFANSCFYGQFSAAFFFSILFFSTLFSFFLSHTGISGLTSDPQLKDPSCWWYLGDYMCYWEIEIECRSAACNASTLPAVQPPWSPQLYFHYLQIQNINFGSDTRN